jgi:hypothetical protein
MIQIELKENSFQNNNGDTIYSVVNELKTVICDTVPLLKALFTHASASFLRSE